MPKTRFFTWYRVAPLAVVLVFGFISLVYSYAPAAFFKPLYPIDYEAYVKQSSSPSAAVSGREVIRHPERFQKEITRLPWMPTARKCRWEQRL